MEKAIKIIEGIMKDICENDDIKNNLISWVNE